MPGNQALLMQARSGPLYTYCIFVNRYIHLCIVYIDGGLTVLLVIICLISSYRQIQAAGITSKSITGQNPTILA